MIIRNALLVCAAAAILISGCDNNKSKTKPEAKPEAKQETKQQAKPEAKDENKASFITTKSGLKYRDTKIGTGAVVAKGDTVTVDYTGSLDDGTVFDTSKKPGGTPFSFTVGEESVIKGWRESLIGMKVGGIRELVIPSSLGYGSEDMGVIPPNSTLHFVIELLDVAKGSGNQ